MAAHRPKEHARTIAAFTLWLKTLYRSAILGALLFLAGELLMLVMYFVMDEGKLLPGSGRHDWGVLGLPDWVYAVRTVGFFLFAGAAVLLLVTCLALWAWGAASERLASRT